MQLDLYADGGNIAAHVHNYADVIEEAVVTAYAEALAGTSSYYNTNACWAWVGVEGCIVSEDNPQGACASCQADSVGVTFIEEIDALAVACAPPTLHTCIRTYPLLVLSPSPAFVARHQFRILFTACTTCICTTVALDLIGMVLCRTCAADTGASAEACGGTVLSFATVSVVAEALAEATAIAYTEAYATCAADEGGYACADAGAFSTDTAHAVAKVLPLHEPARSAWNGMVVSGPY